MSLLHSNRTAANPQAPRLDGLRPRAAIPGGSFEVTGSRLLARADNLQQLPSARFGETAASFDLARANRATVRVPEGAISSDLVFEVDGHISNVLHASVGVPLAENLHLISNPAVDGNGNIFAMVSGARGDRVPVSVFRIDADLQVRPFVRDLLNVSALAFDSAGFLYASSRAEGAVYRISPEGEIATFAEGMGVATGLAFDREGNLFVGDRSGTIFKINPDRQIFVFATLEPSVAAYHLAFRDDGTLLVSAPSTLSRHPLYAIDPDGTISMFFHGLGRPQGMALDVQGNVYVAASLGGWRGIVRIAPDGHDAELFISGNDLVGLCFLDDGCAALATGNTLYHVDLGIEGRPLL
ncbi:MAG TPA: gluconolaconase [Acidobacteriaceae bacterium]|jgi:hypothetical protein